MSWYLGGYKYNRHYDEKFDRLIHRSWDEELSYEGSLMDARVHGNPFVDTLSIARQESTQGMRAQMDAYSAEDAARAAGEKTFGYKEFFDDLPRVCEYTAGFHIFDVDDPELVEHGEAYIHERLTSYLAEPALAPKESWKAWQHYITPYIDYLFINGVAHGVLPGGVVLEPARQRLGLPYEWLGAPID